MPLTNATILNAKPGAKDTKIYDTGGLFLLVKPTGSKWWRLKYSIDGKEKGLSLGVYPDVSLKAARDLRDEARKLLAAGVDPSAQRKATKAAKADRAANSFEVVAREWHTKQLPTWVHAHAIRIIRRLENDIFPWLGGRPIAELKAPELLAVLRKIEKRGAVETAHRALSECGQVMRYAIATGRAERDIAGDLRGALTPFRGNHFAAVTDPKHIGALLRTLDGYEGTMTVGCALQLAPLVFVRPGELRHARWTDFDLEAAEWRYRVTKTDTDHIVPLSSQAVAILRDLEAMSGRSEFVFPGARSPKRPMSDNAILAAMRRMGIPKEEMTGHGFRAMARTVLDEVLKIRVEYIEHQLAHAVKDANGRAYNRTAHLPERHKMMQAWADYLDQLKAGAEVIQFPGAA